MDDVVTVQKCLPTDEEQGLLDSYVSSGASTDLLTDEEKFCILLMKVCPKEEPATRATKRQATCIHKVEGLHPNFTTERILLLSSGCLTALVLLSTFQ